MKNHFYWIMSLFLAVSFSSVASAALLSVTNNNSKEPSDVYVLVPAGLANGELVNIDRTHEFANLPASMVGADYIKTANDDKLGAPDLSIDVTFDTGTTLLLSIDGRVGDEDGSNAPTLGSGVMDWVVSDGWTDTGLTWNKGNEDSDKTKFFVYSLTPTATSYSFQPQENGANRNMYSIAGVPEPSSIVLLGLAGLAWIGLRRRR